MKKQIATLPNQNTFEGYNYDKKKLLFVMLGITSIKGAPKEVITVRCYGNVSKSGMGGNQVSIWCHADQDAAHPGSWAGHANAGGCGYHRPSAALHSAITKAGIKLSEPIDGRGDEVMKEALHAIMVAMGYKRKNNLVVQA